LDGERREQLDERIQIVLDAFEIRKSIFLEIKANEAKLRNPHTSRAISFW